MSLVLLLVATTAVVLVALELLLRSHYSSTFLSNPNPSSPILILPLPSSSFLSYPPPSSPILILPLPSSTFLSNPPPSSPILILPLPSSSFLSHPHPSSPILILPLPSLSFLSHSYHISSPPTYLTHPSSALNSWNIEICKGGSPHLIQMTGLFLYSSQLI